MGLVPLPEEERDWVDPSYEVASPVHGTDGTDNKLTKARLLNCRARGKHVVLDDLQGFIHDLVNEIPDHSKIALYRYEPTGRVWVTLDQCTVRARPPPSPLPPVSPCPCASVTGVKRATRAIRPRGAG
tara:strand:- start:82 stop:465 length:384 start_codon:yes stop_codon:yes gene_type:complete